MGRKWIGCRKRRMEEIDAGKKMGKGGEVKEDAINEENKKPEREIIKSGRWGGSGDKENL